VEHDPEKWQPVLAERLALAKETNHDRIRSDRTMI